jgi:ABC-type bacteriocin/lantibiotic exporter with double-glycine peptidase domain
MRSAPYSSSDIRIIVFLTTLVCRLAPYPFAIFLVLTCLASTLTSFAPFLFPSENNHADLMMYGAALCLGILLTKVSMYIATYLDNKAYKYLSTHMFSAALTDYQKVREGDAAALLNKNEQAAESASVLLHSLFSNILPFVLQVLLITVISGQRIGASMAALLAAASLAQCVLSILFARKLRQIQVKIIHAEADAYSNANETFTNIKCVAAYRSNHVFLRRFALRRSVYETLIDHYNRIRLAHNAAQVMVISLVLFPSFYLVNFEIAILVSVNFILLLVIQGFESIGHDFIAINDSLAKFKESESALALLRNNIKTPPTETLSGGAFQLRLVKFNNLGFSLKEPLTIQDRQLVTIIGPSGVGKTTLLEAIAGIRDSEEWEIHLNARKLSQLDHAQLSKIFTIAYHDTDIFMDSLLFNITLSDTPLAADVQRCRALTATLGLSGLEDTDCHPNTLSSGEKLRIGIARAMYQRRAIYLFDEPTANLDAKNTEALLEIISQLRKEHIVICTSHDPTLIAASDLRLRFENGLIRAD